MVASPHLHEAVAVVPWLCKFLPRIHPKLQQPGSSCNQTYFLPESFSFHVHVHTNPGPVRPLCAIRPGSGCQLITKEAPSSPATIVLPSCVVGVISWDVEARVREAQQTQPDLGNGPPDSVKSQVLQRGHVSQTACHPGCFWTLKPDPSAYSSSPPHKVTP